MGRLIFSYRLMRGLGNDHVASAAKALLLAFGHKVFVYR